MSATLFSWGYFGWGNATDRLIQLVSWGGGATGAGVRRAFGLERRFNHAIV